MENGNISYDREVPTNDHVWQELDGLIGQVRAFQERAAVRREKLTAAAAEMGEAEAKCSRILEELAATGGAVARAT